MRAIELEDRLVTRSLLLVALFAVNPLSWALGQTVFGLFPDSMVYLSYAAQAVAKGQLFLAGYGHVDGGMVLPPLYPMMIGLAARLGADPILAAQALSSAALLFALVPLFVWIERLSSAAVAAAAVLAIEWHPFYLVYGTAALTEGLFLAGITLLGWATLRTAAGPTTGHRSWFLLGLGVGVLFLCRQLGAFFFGVLAIVAVLAGGVEELRRTPGHALRRLALVTGGCALLLAPYFTLLHMQTAVAPTTQHFRLGNYAVVSTAPVDAPAVAADYEALYRARRAQRALLPDGSEMVGFVDGGTLAGGAALQIATPVVLGQNLARNLQHLAAALGWPAVGLLVLALAAGFLVLPAGTPRAAAWVLPLTICGYLGFVSLFGSSVARYAEAVYPFAIAMIFVAGHAVCAPLLRRAPTWALPLGAASLALALMLASYPRTAAALHTSPRFGLAANPLRDCRALIAPGDPVFALMPLEAYLLGGTYRILPDAALPRIAEYGRRTGVRWLLLRRSALNRDESAYYSSSPWLSDPDAAAVTGTIAEICRSNDGSAILYRLSR